MNAKTLLSLAAFVLCCMFPVCGMETDTIDVPPIDPPDQPQNPSVEILGSDTVFYAQGECLPGEDLSQAAVSFRLENDILYIDGTVEANCCGVHHLVFFIMPDSISIQVYDEGDLCDCHCLYAIHEQIEGCEGKEYILGFENKNTETEKTIRLSAEDKTGIPDNRNVTFTQPDCNTLCVNTGDEAFFALKIYGLSGQLQLFTQAKSGEYIDIASLAAGIYMLEVNGRVVRKIIKQ